MPQSKGTATWLTNVRQDAPLERVRLDNSRAKIENKKIDHEHGKKVEIIRMKYHRSKADIKFELKQAREEADRWRMMRLQLDKNRVRSAVESRRKETMLQRQKLDGAKYTIIGPDGEILHSNNANGTRQTGGQTLFPNVKQSGKLFRKSVSVGGSETGDHNKRPITIEKVNTQVFSSDSEVGDTDDDSSISDDDVFNSHVPSNLKPSIPSKPESNQRKRDQWKSVSGTNFFRPRTSFSTSSFGSEYGLEHSSGKPGRSFQELKDLTHIDKITDNIKANKRTRILKIRHMHQAQEQERLQKRIDSFCVDVEILKRKLTPAPKDADKKNPFRIASWS